MLSFQQTLRATDWLVRYQVTRLQVVFAGSTPKDQIHHSAASWVLEKKYLEEESTVPLDLGPIPTPAARSVSILSPF